MQNQSCNFSPFDDSCTKETKVAGSKQGVSVQENDLKNVDNEQNSVKLHDEQFDLKESHDNLTSSSETTDCSGNLKSETDEIESASSKEFESLEESITPKMINNLRMKLTKYREYKDIFESFEKINLELTSFEDKLPSITPDKLSKRYSSTTGDIQHLNRVNDTLNKELKQVKRQLESRTRQLDKATELLKMMQKGLEDRGAYIKMLIRDNKRLRDEVKLAVIERRNLCEKFVDDFEDLPVDTETEKDELEDKK